MLDGNNLIGQSLGNYTLLQEVDSGTFGTVYQAKHAIFEDEPIVAIKVLHAPFRSPQERQQFVQEANILKKLAHPAILRILDAGFHHNLPYLVTEYAPGGSLRDRLLQHAGQPIPLDEALAMLDRIGQALHFAHQQGIVHRDLKPANILFNSKGEAILADFGIAIVLSTQHTYRAGRGGTPAYMAPEQFEGFVSIKSDQYALGCIAYELFTGKHPFLEKGMSLEALWYRHAQVNPPALTLLNALISPSLEQAVLTALAKQRNQRHSDVTAFLAALHPSPTEAKRWLEKSDTHKNLKRYEEAIAYYTRAIKLDPTSALAYYQCGITLHELKRYEEAVADYTQAIKLNPADATAYNNRGYALSNLERYEEAIADHTQAIKLDPSYALAYYNRSLAHKALKHEQQAKADYNRALALGYHPS